MKKLLSIFGILLLLGAVILGTHTFVQRKKNHEIAVKPSDAVTNSQNTEQQQAKFNKTKYSIDDPSSIWVIANKNRPLNPLTYSPSDLVEVGNNQQMRTEAATALTTLIAGAKAEGLTIQALSGYRSYSKQVTVYNNEVSKYGQAVADSESAKPGYSEHQTGLAVDVGGGGCGIEDCFGETAEGKWLALNAYRYGFIVRYTAEKQSITGYRAEPWHIRYIGTELSNEMHEQNVTTLEEFFGL